MLYTLILSYTSINELIHSLITITGILEVYTHTNHQHISLCYTHTNHKHISLCYTHTYHQHISLCYTNQLFCLSNIYMYIDIGRAIPIIQRIWSYICAAKDSINC